MRRSPSAQATIGRWGSSLNRSSVPGRAISAAISRNRRCCRCSCRFYEFGMSVQAAVEQPRFANYNFPNSFAPYQYHPGRLCAEKPIADRLGDAYAPTAGGMPAPTAAGKAARRPGEALPRGTLDSSSAASLLRCEFAIRLWQRTWMIYNERSVGLVLWDVCRQLSRSHRGQPVNQET